MVTDVAERNMMRMKKTMNVRIIFVVARLGLHFAF